MALDQETNKQTKGRKLTGRKKGDIFRLSKAMEMKSRKDICKYQEGSLIVKTHGWDT